MTLTNHLLTGAALSKFLPLPVALPLAFASHFILDALPHFGFPSIDVRMKHLRLMKVILCIDFLLSVAISIWLIALGHTKWLLVGIVAYSPDFVWIYRFAVKERFGKVQPTKGNIFVQFHKNIQKYERIWGVCIELLYGLVVLVVLR